VLYILFLLLYGRSIRPTNGIVIIVKGILNKINTVNKTFYPIIIFIIIKQ
jgi:hypothetical protein